jgi:hypothetical protein
VGLEGGERDRLVAVEDGAELGGAGGVGPAVEDGVDVRGYQVVAYAGLVQGAGDGRGR